MSEFSINKLLPPKFNGTDKPIPFLQWKDAVETYIMSLDGAVFNELRLPRPVPMAPAVPAAAVGRGGRGAAPVVAAPIIPDDEAHLYQEEGYVSSGQNKAKIAAIIKSSLDHTLVGEYIGRDITREPQKIWESINNRYDRNTEGAKQELMTELQHVRMRRGESIDTHVARLNSIWNRMTTKGEPPSLSTKRFFLLNRLSDDYKEYAATLNTRADDTTIETMIQLLKDRCDELERQKRVGDNREEQKEVANIAHGEREKHNEEMAGFVGRGRGGRGWRGRGRGNGRRDNSNKRDHPYRKDEKRDGASSSSSSYKEIICYNCFSKGHTYAVCTNKPVCKLCRVEGHKESGCKYGRGGRGGSRGRNSIQDTSLPREKDRTADWRGVKKKKRRGETKKEKKKSRKNIQSE
jgi:hypothetical protein